MRSTPPRALALKIYRIVSFRPLRGTRLALHPRALASRSVKSGSLWTRPSPHLSLSPLSLCRRNNRQALGHPIPSSVPIDGLSATQWRFGRGALRMPDALVLSVPFAQPISPPGGSYGFDGGSYGFAGTQRAPLMAGRPILMACLTVLMAALMALKKVVLTVLMATLMAVQKIELFQRRHQRRHQGRHQRRHQAPSGPFF